MILHVQAELLDFLRLPRCAGNEAVFSALNRKIHIEQLEIFNIIIHARHQPEVPRVDAMPEWH